MRSMTSTATPYSAATCPAVIPYFTQPRMRANCDAGISGNGRRPELTGASRSGSAGVFDSALRTRGWRADCALRVEGSGAGGSLIGRFALNSASAARRALVIRSRSSCGGEIGRLRLNKEILAT